MKPEDVEALLMIVKYFGAFALTVAILYGVTCPIFNYMVRYHKNFMKKVIPGYFEE